MTDALTTQLEAAISVRSSSLVVIGTTENILAALPRAADAHVVAYRRAQWLNAQHKAYDAAAKRVEQEMKKILAAHTGEI